MRSSAPKFRDALQQLVASPSVSSTRAEIDQSNRPAIELLAGWLESLGFRTQLQQLDARGGKVNLYASAGPVTGAGLIFSGHMDTVPCDPNLWNGNPFDLRETHRGYQGLGATDMKGFFAVLVETLRDIDLSLLTKPLIIVATADEESSMIGARKLIDSNFQAGSKVIVGEPTDLVPVRIHKGILMESIRVQGQGGHSSDPALGINAMEVMRDVMTELLDLRTKIQQAHRHPGFAVQVPTLNLGCIHGGDNPNRICSRCEIQFDLRTLPGMLNEAVRAQIDEILAPIAARWQCEVVRESLFPGVEAFEQPLESAWVEQLSQDYGLTSGYVSFATEAPFYRAMGLDTLILGPGSIAQAHAINEFLPGDQVEPAIDIYRRLILQNCVTQD